MSNSFVSAFKGGPKTVTVLGGTNGYSNPAFSGSMGYGDSKVFQFDGFSSFCTVSVSQSGQVSVTSDQEMPIGYVGAFVSLPEGTTGQIADASSSMDTSSLVARVGRSLGPGQYSSTSLGAGLSASALGSPDPFGFTTPDPSATSP